MTLNAHIHFLTALNERTAAISLKIWTLAGIKLIPEHRSISFNASLSVNAFR
jgi:hypothetical protein